MTMKRYLTVYTVPEQRQGAYALSVQPCQEGVHFQRDRPIRFEARLTRGGRPCSTGELYAYFKWNSEQVVWHAVLPLVDGRARIDFTCEQCGFGNLHVIYRRNGAEVFEQLRGIAISPERLRRSYSCPPDFDAFWRTQKAALAAIPLVARATPITPTSHSRLHGCSHRSLVEGDASAVEIADVQVDCTDRPVSGILTLPRRRSARSLPAVLYLHGAGVRPCEPGRFLAQAARGAMVYEINAHGIANDQPAAWYAARGNDELLGYAQRGRDSRERYYFLGMFLRVKRALDYLISRPEWDGRNLVVMGGSQGAAQAYAGAYLEDRVSAIAASIPAYGDLTGFLRGRRMSFDDWLHLGPRGLLAPEITAVAPYFDAVNFLRRYRRRLCVAFGLLDQGCLPTTNFVPIAECPAAATVILQSDVYHRVTPAADAMMWDFALDREVRSGRKITAPRMTPSPSDRGLHARPRRRRQQAQRHVD